jgi:hypothetical protein
MARRKPPSPPRIAKPISDAEAGSGIDLTADRRLEDVEEEAAEEPAIRVDEAAEDAGASEDDIAADAALEKAAERADEEGETEPRDEDEGEERA